MKFIDCSYNEFVNKIENNRIIQFGASTGWDYYASVFPDIYSEIVEKTDYIVDNNNDKVGTHWDVVGKRIEIKSPDAICKEKSPIVLIVVRLGFQDKICEQLLKMELPECAECYSLQLMIGTDEKVDNRCVGIYFKEHTKKQIPAKIHSFWFSGEEKPDKYKKCIDSWYKYCPDYEICEWNCDNYDVYQNKYMQQALECRKWAFVSDYARLDVIYQFGGFYFDMDVELLAPIDEMRNATSFFCRQNDGTLDLGSGFGAVKSNVLIKQLLNAYNDLEFMKNDGTMDMLPQPSRLMPVFYKYGVKRTHDSQMLDEILILSNDYFTCIHGAPDKWNWKGTELGIHWHNAGWMSVEKRQMMEEDQLIKQQLITNYFTGE